MRQLKITKSITSRDSASLDKYLQEIGREALLPVEEEEQNEVMILRIDSVDDENENYVGIDDEEILQKVFDIFKERYKDDYDFE